MDKLTIIIINWNGGKVLGDCLASIYASEPWGDAFEVFLIDNASTDKSQMRASQAYPSLKLIQNSKNLGFARAINQVLPKAQGDFILLLNPDVKLHPEAISIMANFMKDHQDAAVVGPKLLNPDGTTQGSARKAPSLLTGLFGRNAILTKLFPKNPLSRQEMPGLDYKGEYPLKVDWVSGACLMVRREAYEQVGFMDDHFFLFWEDADWCLRFAQGGWKVYFYPLAEATHYVGISRSQRPLKSVVDFHTSAYRFYRKHELSTPTHPMIILLVGGLMLSFSARFIQALFTKR